MTLFVEKYGFKYQEDDFVHIITDINGNELAKISGENRKESALNVLEAFKIVSYAIENPNLYRVVKECLKSEEKLSDCYML